MQQVANNNTMSHVRAPPWSYLLVAFLTFPRTVLTAHTWQWQWWSWCSCPSSCLLCSVLAKDRPRLSWFSLRSY